MKLVLAIGQLVVTALLALGLIMTAFCLLRFLDSLCDAARVTALGPSLTHALAVLVGALAMWLWGLARGRERRRALPPATARQIERATRANRLEARDPPPRWIPLPKGSFADEEETK